MQWKHELCGRCGWEVYLPAEAYQECEHFEPKKVFHFKPRKRNRIVQIEAV
jgi:hypothetical protein